MIKISKKNDCCGCNACSLICPKHCIAMKMDEEGFFYPIVDVSICVHCGLCEKVCPMINSKESVSPIEVFAAKNDNEEVRSLSSSGGIVSLLAENILCSGGKVVGAIWNDSWHVEHEFIDNVGDLHKIRSSKYLQSDTKDTYKRTKYLLEDGIEVMYTGTPCQIAALKLYLRKTYDNLLAVECVCQSVPSPGVWTKYLHERVEKDRKQLSDIVNISFRNKETGWKGYSCSIDYSDSSRYFEYRERFMDVRFSRWFVYPTVVF